MLSSVGLALGAIGALPTGGSPLEGPVGDLARAGLGDDGLYLKEKIIRSKSKKKKVRNRRKRREEEKIFL